MPEQKPLAELLAEANALLSKQPVSLPNLDKANRYPYYREHFAEEILEVVNHVIASRSPIIWGLSRGTMHTLYHKYNQACRFIADHPHKFPEDALKKLDYVKIMRMPGVGLKFAPQRSLFHLSTDTDWKGDYQAFINNSTPGESFERVGLKLTKADNAWCYQIIRPVITLFAMSIGVDSIKLVRLQ